VPLISLCATRAYYLSDVVHPARVALKVADPVSQSRGDQARKRMPKAHPVFRESENAARRFLLALSCVMARCEVQAATRPYSLAKFGVR
jgi:hypothetical protein